MHANETQDLLELDVQEFEVPATAAEPPSQQIPPRTVTACTLC
ncbi:hypothetical protein [Amycolatopsis sacchari]